MSKNCAAPSLFGWDFQVNAAIAILIDNIKDVDKVRLEGSKQDIEITLSNKENSIPAKAPEYTLLTQKLDRIFPVCYTASK